jgi:hypothetical protein
MIAAAGMERFVRNRPAQQFDASRPQCNIVPASSEHDRAYSASIRGGVHVPAKSAAGIYPGDEALVEGAIP